MDAAQGKAAANRESLNELGHASRVDCCMSKGANNNNTQNLLTAKHWVVLAEDFAVIFHTFFCILLHRPGPPCDSKFEHVVSRPKSVGLG